MFAKFKQRERKRTFANIIPHSLTYPHYEPASPQAEAFHNSNKHIKAIFGGDRAGKTSTTSYELITKIREYPGQLYWAAALTEEKLAAIWKWHKKFLAPWEIIGKPKWRKSGIIPEYVHLPQGGLLQYKTWKSGPGSFSAESVFAIQLDEDGQRVISTAESAYDDCLSRIMDCNGYIFLGATPILGKNWMYYRIHLKNAQERKKMGYSGENLQDPDIESWNVSSLDNKFIDEEYKIRQKGRLTADEIDRRFYGLFTTLQGACFKEWNDTTMVKDFGTLPASIRKGVGIDLGYKHPFCAEFGAYSDDSVLYFYDEWYKRETLLKDHANAIRLIEQNMDYWHGLNFRQVETRVCDHERQTRAELEDAGIWTEPADKDVDMSIALMNRMMKEGRFIVHPRCYELARTLPLYHYKEQRIGSDQKEQPVKEDDDPVDSSRYLSMYFEGRNYDISGGFAGTV